MTDVMKVLASISRLVTAIAEAVARGDRTRVDEILPPALRSSLVKADLDEQARQKFGA